MGYAKALGELPRHRRLPRPGGTYDRNLAHLRPQRKPPALAPPVRFVLFEQRDIADATGEWKQRLGSRANAVQHLFQRLAGLELRQRRVWLRLRDLALVRRKVGVLLEQ